jgi:hypothetical protein
MVFDEIKRLKEVRKKHLDNLIALYGTKWKEVYRVEELDREQSEIDRMERVEFKKQSKGQVGLGD